MTEPTPDEPAPEPTHYRVLVRTLDGAIHDAVYDTEVFERLAVAARSQLAYVSSSRHGYMQLQTPESGISPSMTSLIPWSAVTGFSYYPCDLTGASK